MAQDLGDLNKAVKEALEVKKNRYGFKHLGENKTLLCVFFNNSLRTRLSTQKAGMNLGMNTMVLDVNQGAGSWRPSVASSWTATSPSICWRLSL